MVSSVKQCERPTNHRFKGIEALLRRIAFNLGNSPSKTEVKIISCIPIDVTDLQQKIICLEKQLALARGRGNRSQTNNVTINRVELQTAYPPDSSPSKNDQPDLASLHADALPSDTDCKSEKTALQVSPEFSSEVKAQDSVKSPISNPTPAEIRLKPRQRKYKIPEKDRTRLVYYAQMAGASNPFTNYKNINIRKRLRDETIDRKFLSSVIERQYRSKDMRECLSQMSEPVCRDMTPMSTSDDMCSCCEGNYLDLDRKKKTQPVYASVIDGGTFRRNSHFYDMKPVSDRPDKRNENLKKSEPDLDLTFCPEYYPFKPEYSLQTDLLSQNHINKSVKYPKTRHTEQVVIHNDSSQTEGMVEFSQVYTRLLPPTYRNKCNMDKPNLKHANCTVHASEKNTGYMESKLIQTLSSEKIIFTSAHLNKTENNQCVHKTISNTEESPMRATKSLQTLSLSKLKSEYKSLCKVTSKNAECLALTMNETECQTEPLNVAQFVLTNPAESDGTEPSLNQIKNILETVLTEVKVCAQLRSNIEEKEPKDAVTHKDSMPMPDCERFLGSYTYNPYTATTPREFQGSCSRCLPSYCSSAMPQAFTVPPLLHQPTAPIDYNYIRNYPIFIHRTLATQACGHDRSDVMKSKQTSTNTMQEPQKKRTTETETLIKEIYKSIALNVNSPKQAMSHPTIEDKAIPKTSNSEFKTANTMTQAREELIYRGNTGPSRMRILHNRSSPTSLAELERHGGSFFQRPRIVTSAMRRQGNLDASHTKLKVKEDSGDTSDSNNFRDVFQPSATPAKSGPIGGKKNFLKKVVSSLIKKIYKREDKSAGKAHNAHDSDWCDEANVTQRTKPVKHVSYAPSQPRTWRDVAGAGENGERDFVPRTRRPSRSNAGWEQDPRANRPQTQSYMSPSGRRAYLGSSQHRRDALLSNPQHRPRPMTEYPRRPPSQYNSRHAPYVTRPNDNRPRLQTRPPGLKISNKAWMRRPVYHFGFACGPEKRKIMTQH